MKLIDADALIKRIEIHKAACEAWTAEARTETGKNIGTGAVKAFQISLLAINEIPTIDAVPVRHGEWKPFDLTYGRSIYSCSVCEQATEVPMCVEKPMYAYCPNCGAKMIGEQNVE